MGAVLTEGSEELFRQVQRHSVAVHLLRRGADIRHIQAFLGHANLNTTKIYLRLVPGYLAEDYEKAMPEIETGLGVVPGNRENTAEADRSTPLNPDDGVP